MREIRTSGSEGGGAGNLTGPPYPYGNFRPAGDEAPEGATPTVTLHMKHEAPQSLSAPTSGVNVKGRKAGEMTEFSSQYLFNTRLHALP